MFFSNLNFASKKIIVTRLICFFWLVAKFISWKVWLADRLFPVVPPFNFLFAPSMIHLLLFVCSLLSLFALGIFPIKRSLQWSVIIIEVLSCLLDQNRWQPWEYQYIFIILILLINSKNERHALAAIGFTFVSVYFFSGIGKMNPLFSLGVRNKIVDTGFFHLSNSAFYQWLEYHAGYLLGSIEALLGIGLLFKVTRKGSTIFLITMHLVILVIFGPIGMDYDRIIWPWNVAMMMILYIFFVRSMPVPISFQSVKKGWNKLIIIFFGFLPVLNLFGYWDYFLSSSLFSFKPPEMYICIRNPGTAKALQPYFAKNTHKFLCNGNSPLINVRAWSFSEMQVPAYPEIRVYESIKEQLLKRYPDMNATFVVLPYFNGKKNIIELK